MGISAVYSIPRKKKREKMPSLPWAHLTLFKTVILCYDEGVYKMNTFHLIYCLSRGRKTAYNAVKKGEVHAADGDRAVFDTGLCGVYLFFR